MSRPTGGHRLWMDTGYGWTQQCQDQLEDTGPQRARDARVLMIS